MSESDSPMRTMLRDLLARKEAEREAAIEAVLEKCHHRDLVRWGIEEYERQLQAAREWNPE